MEFAACHDLLHSEEQGGCKTTQANQHKARPVDNILEEQSAETGDHPSTIQAKAVMQLQLPLL